MKHKIKKILELIKDNNFNEAKIICDNIKNKLEKNFEFINIHGYILFHLNSFASPYVIMYATMDDVKTMRESYLNYGDEKMEKKTKKLEKKNFGVSII